MKEPIPQAEQELSLVSSLFDCLIYFRTPDAEKVFPASENARLCCPFWFEQPSLFSQSPEFLPASQP